MLLLYLVILGGCLVCEEIAVDPRKVNPDRTCSQAGLVLVGGSPWYVVSGPTQTNLFLSVLRAEPPFSQGSRGVQE